MGAGNRWQTLLQQQLYVCVDAAPEVAIGGVRQYQAMLLFVKVGCGTLSCSKFNQGWELPCVVCTK